MNLKVPGRIQPSSVKRAGLSAVPLSAAGVGLVTALLGACNALDEPGPEGSVVVIPTDTREALLSAEPPAPISGGTLAMTTDGVAIVADPDRDRVSIVRLASDDDEVTHIELREGDEPGRVALDDTGRAYVALRRGGELAVIDIAGRALEQRVPVCAAPRGVAFQASQRALHVACSEGRLVTLNLGPARPAAPIELEWVRELQVEDDLRDVLIQADELWVSTFKRAELLRVDSEGLVMQRAWALQFERQLSPFSVKASGNSLPEDTTMQPHLAYRSIGTADGQMFMLHQGASIATVDIEQSADPNEGSPYGSSVPGGCDGIVVPAITRIDAGGKVTTVPIASGVLSVDMALSEDGRTLGVVQAGAQDEEAPVRRTVVDTDGDSTAVSIAQVASARPFDGLDLTGTPSTRVTLLDVNADNSGCGRGVPVAVPGQATSIAAMPAPSRGWLVQSREPAMLTFLPELGASQAAARTIDLGGQSVRDTGHDIFHRDAGAGVACASCHAEGGEDGHVWSFSSIGTRRTQALHIGLEGTAPFHWDGDQADMNHLMETVFVGRMGGVHQSDERLSALTRWLFALQPPAAPAARDTQAVERGAALFASAEVGCSDCHSGDRLTNNLSVDVGTGAVLQVPSLRGIAYRAPFMHNGCARTLHDRFSAACGGDAHGNVASLSPAAIDDLVAYLRTL